MGLEKFRVRNFNRFSCGNSIRRFSFDFFSKIIYSSIRNMQAVLSALAKKLDSAIYDYNETAQNAAQNNQISIPWKMTH